MLKADNFVDVVERNRDNPSFAIPSLTERESLRTGDVVKLITRGERIWAEVIGRALGTYVGSVLSDPIATDVRRGGLVEFEPRHVADFGPRRNDS